MQTVFSHSVFTFSFICCSLLCKISGFECKYKIRTCIWKMWLESVRLPACILFSLINGDSHFVFMFFWQSICSILRHLVSKEFAGKQKFARRHWKNAFFHPAKCCHWQLPSHYMQTMCESIIQAPSPPLLSGEGSWSELHIFQDKGLFNILFNSVKQVSDFYQRSIFMSSN